MLHEEPNKIDSNHKNTVKPVVAGLAGVIAGAAGVTILALTDKDIRKKVIKRTKEAKASMQKWSADKLQEVQDESNKESIEDSLQMQEEKVSN